jgi:hypothetical protein
MIPAEQHPGVRTEAAGLDERKKQSEAGTGCRDKRDGRRGTGEVLASS